MLIESEDLRARLERKLKDLDWKMGLLVDDPRQKARLLWMWQATEETIEELDKLVEEHEHICEIC